MRSREIADLIGEVVAGEGAELVDVEVGGSGRRPLLRAFVEIPGGTTVDACAELSRRIEARLDASRLLGERYTLEVSSPGLDRPLRTRRDFERLRGRSVEVRRREAAAGGPRVVGMLEAVGETGAGGFWILLRPEGAGEPLRFEEREIAFAKPHVPW